MSRMILITGGAGFIGSHLADELLAAGHRVRALDDLSEQVHGPERSRPAYLADEVELIVGDVRDPETLRGALKGIEAVVHLAARVGVGQSMYQVAEYVGVNDLGTAVLLQELIEHPVENLVVASSMSVYGEGLYRDAGGQAVQDAERKLDDLRARRWDPLDAAGQPLAPVATPESKRPSLASVYALGKYAQERLCLLIGQAYEIPTTALRLFNVYGTRQALSNPYTGVLAIFASRLLNDRSPLVFEDGKQRRDFVHVRDVARACRLALETPAAAGEVLNIGSGHEATVEGIARRLGSVVGKPEIEPELTGRYRVGDIRHCFADVALAERVLGFRAEWDLERGLEELAGWLAGQAAVDRAEDADGELATRGLTI